ncbi:MAG TPA: hypothetical protein VIG04_01625 [Gemmatimonadales bacterium]
MWHPTQNQRSLRVDSENREPFGHPRKSREDSSYLDTLELGKNPLGARLTAVIDHVVTVPTGSPRSHLSEPRPDFAWWTPNGDRMSQRRADGFRQKLVARQPPRTFIST